MTSWRSQPALLKAMELSTHSLGNTPTVFGEFGTYFIGYARSPGVTEEMLDNMFIGRPPGTYDRILDFSTAVTGALFFTPITDFLNDPPPRPGRKTESDRTDRRWEAPRF